MNTRCCFLLMICLLLCKIAAAGAGNKEAPLHDLGSGGAYCLVENKGQITDQNGRPRNDIRFLLRAGKNMSVSFEPGAIHYEFRRLDNAKELQQRQLEYERQLTKDPNAKLDITASRFTRSVLDMVLVGSNPEAVCITDEKQAYFENYYLPQCPQGITQVPTYKRITWKNVYPDIDWVIYTDGNRLKYDFMLHEGARPGDIRIRYSGATGTRRLEDGSLRISNPLGDLTEDAPLAYEQTGGKRIPCRWVQKGTVWTLATGTYQGGLVIDPALDWGTYFGGPSFESGSFPFGKGVDTDDEGNAYICGVTESATNIATSGAYLDTLNGWGDGFVAKFNASGALLWSTYYGGEGYDLLHNVCVDGSGNVYGGGMTVYAAQFPNTMSYTGIATPGAWQTTTDIGFLVKFNSQGMRIWGTYYPVVPEGMTADAAGNVYMISKDVPVTQAMTTPGTFIYPVTNNTNGYIAKFNTQGQRIWGSFYKGSPLDITLSTGDRYLYIAGGTLPFAPDALGIATPGAFQFSPGGNTDAFIAKFDTSGNRIWGTYYGGDGGDWAYGVALGPNDDVYIGGVTFSFFNIASTHSHQQNFAGGSDAFVARFDSSGQRIWGSYYGGLGGETGVSVGVNSCGDAYLAGYKWFYAPLNDGIATPDALDTAHQGNLLMSDIILGHFDGNSGRLNWGTYYGNHTRNHISGVAINPAGNFFIYGFNYFYNSSDLATPGAYKTNGDAFDYWLLRWQEVSIVNLPDTVLLCDSVFTLPYYVSDTFRSDNSFTAELSDSSGNFFNPAPVVIGAVQDSLSGSITCTVPTGVVPGQPYLLRVTASHPKSSGSCWRVIRFDRTPPAPIVADVTLCKGQPADTLEVISDRHLQQLWYNDPVGGVALPHAPVPDTSVAGTHVWYVSQMGKGGFCESGRSRTEVTVKALPDPSFILDTVVCAHELLSVSVVGSAAGAYTWNFDGAQIHSGSGAGPYDLSWSQSGTHLVSLQINLNGCMADTQQEVKVLSTPEVSVIAHLTGNICFNDSVRLEASGADNYSWSTPGSVLEEIDPVKRNRIVAEAQTGSYIVHGFNENGCSASDTVFIAPVQCCDVPFIASSFTPNGDGLNDGFSPHVRLGQRLLTFSVYNRWGELVYQANSEPFNWDGTYKQQPAEVGTYQYLFRVDCGGGKTMLHKGDITLIR